MRIFLILLLFQQAVFAFDADCCEKLQEGLKNGEEEIELTGDIVLENDSLPSPSPKANIEGFGKEINGSNNSSGFTLNSGQSLGVDNVKVKNFSGNLGAFIDNEEGTVENLQGEFMNNAAADSGGVVSNKGYIDKIQGEFHNNTSVNNGGVLFNAMDGKVGSIKGNFSKNSTETGLGGAIYNTGKIGEIEGNFSENTGNFLGGGAIYNNGDIKKVSGNFENNHAETDYFGGGGAIFNSGSIKNLSGKFINNTAANLGGAVHNMYGTITFSSDQEEVEFTGNSDSTGSNAIFNGGGEINFNAGKYDITINDGISGEIHDYPDSVINLNKDGSGTININNNVSDNTIYLYQGTLKFGNNNQGENTYFGNFLNSVNFFYNGGILDFRNDYLQNTTLGNLTLNNDMEIYLDIDFEKNLSDTFGVSGFSPSGHYIDIYGFNRLSPAVEKSYSFNLFDLDMKDNLRNLLKEAFRYKGESVVNLPIYKYSVFYDKSSGSLNFNRIDNEFNPSVLSGGVAAQVGGYLTQINSYEYVFRNMDMYYLSKNFPNRYAYNERKVYKLENGNLWIMPYAVFENVPLKNAPKVSNFAYGSFFGHEFEPLKLKRGWTLVYGNYGAYNGSHQEFEGINIYQNGGTIGGVAMAYKGKFFVGFTANVSANACKSEGVAFPMIMTGGAVKSGYNLHIKDEKFIIQPNCLLSYTFVNTFNFKNEYNVKIKSSPLNAIQIFPAVRIFANLDNQYQPYINVGMVWNIIDKAKFFANDVSLPILSVKPFVLYGAGVRKSVPEKYSCFGQTYLTGGGRNGVGLQFGVSWDI